MSVEERTNRSLYTACYTVDGYRYKTIESLGKNFVTFVLKFFRIDSIGITYKFTRKKLEYKSYKVFSYRFYRYPTTVWFRPVGRTKNF